MPAKGVCLRAENLSLALLFFDWSTLFVQSETTSLFSHAFVSGLSSTFFILTIPLTSVRRKASGNMKPQLLAIFKFCTSNQLFKPCFCPGWIWRGAWPPCPTLWLRPGGAIKVAPTLPLAKTYRIFPCIRDPSIFR